MSFRITTRDKRSSDVLKVIAALIFLTFYAAGSTGFGILHKLLHTQHKSLTHSAEQEKDPCHRSIYHFGEGNICAHAAHLLEAENCDQCHVLSHIDQIVVTDLVAESVEPYAINIVSSSPVPLQGIATHLPSRAPPLI